MRKPLMIALAGAMLAGLLPMGAATADHCENEIVLMSGRGATRHDVGWYGCVTWYATDQVGAAQEVDTDYIMPGANSMRVRVYSITEPEGTITFAGITGPAVNGCFPGGCNLQFTQVPGIAQWNSGEILVSLAETIDGGEAVVDVCWDEGDTCKTRTYRTVE